MIKKLSIFLMVFAYMICLIPKTTNAMVVYDPTNHEETLATKLQLIESYKKQLEQLQAQLKNLEKLDIGQNTQSVKEVQDLVKTLNEIRTATNAIGTDYKTAMDEFDKLNPDYATWNGAPASKYAEQIEKFNEALEKSIKQALQTEGIVSPEESQKTADSVQRILDSSQNAEGAMGAIQAANQMSALQIKELIKMQTIMADSIKTQNLYIQKQIDAEKQAKKRYEDFTVDSDKYKEGYETTNPNADYYHFGEKK